MGMANGGGEWVDNDYVNSCAYSPWTCENKSSVPRSLW